MQARPDLPPPALPPVPLTHEEWAREDFKRLAWFTARHPYRTRYETPRWAHKAFLRSPIPPSCAACGVSLSSPSQQQAAHELVLSPVIAPTVGGHRVGRMLLLLCRTCARSRGSRPDVLDWPDAHADKKRWKAILAVRNHALPFCINHPTRRPWKTKPPVLRELRERWCNPRSSVFIAWRDQWDNGLDQPEVTPFDGWALWPNGHPPSGLARHILTRAGWTAWTAAEDIPGWTVGTVPGSKMQDLVWALIDANTWIRRLALAEAPYAHPNPGAPPPPFDSAPYLAAAIQASGDDFEDVGLLFDGPRRAAVNQAQAAAEAAHAEQVREYEAALVRWHAWPPPPFGRNADDDWWRAFWTVGQCVRRHATPERTGRFAPRRPGYRPKRR